MRRGPPTVERRLKSAVDCPESQANGESGFIEQTSENSALVSTVGAPLR
jgi:hypothetical protein